MLFQGPVQQGTSQALLPLRPRAAPPLSLRPCRSLVLEPCLSSGSHQTLGRGWRCSAGLPQPQGLALPLSSGLWIGAVLLFACPLRDQLLGVWASGVSSVIRVSVTSQPLGPPHIVPRPPTYNLPVSPQSSHPRPPSCPKPGSMARFCLCASCLLNNSVCHTVTPSPAPLDPTPGLAWAG